jgi:hypothetical protein
VAISTPHRQNGLLWRKFDAHYGKDDDRVLVIRGSSMQLNPTLDETEVQAALERDPAAGAAEYLGEFRADLESFLSREVIDAAVDKDRPIELPVQRGCRISASSTRPKAEEMVTRLLPAWRIWKTAS